MTRIKFVDDIFNGKFLIGFEELVEHLEEASNCVYNHGAFPPHNIIKVDDENQIVEFALAGFSKNEVNVTYTEGKHEFTVSGEKKDKDEREKLHQGISNKKFKRVFPLGSHWKVTGGGMDNGILKVNLTKEVPETMKPKDIKID